MDSENYNATSRNFRKNVKKKIYYFNLCWYHKKKYTQMIKA